MSVAIKELEPSFYEGEKVELLCMSCEYRPSVKEIAITGNKYGMKHRLTLCVDCFDEGFGVKIDELVKIFEQSIANKTINQSIVANNITISGNSYFCGR